MAQTMLKADILELDATGAPLKPGPRIDICPIPVNLYRGLERESLPSGLFSNLKDAIFTKRQPPLHLTSTPVAVKDPMAVHRDPRLSALSFAIHALVVALILWFTFQMHRVQVLPLSSISKQTVQPIYMPPIARPAPTIEHGGGGAPRVVVKQTSVPLPQHVQKLNVSSRDVLQQPHPMPTPPPSFQHISANSSLPSNLLAMAGSFDTPHVAMASQASGTAVGMGQGIGGGIGAGSSGGLGGGIMSVGGGVSAPVLVHSVQPQLSDQARQARYAGVVAIQLIVDANGNPENMHIVHHLGMGLDQKAIEAVRQYKFKPAMYQGHPVAVRMVVDVSFHVF
jgi:TonB family protein